jgi:hypothetical protein
MRVDLLKALVIVMGLALVLHFVFSQSVWRQV